MKIFTKIYKVRNIYAQKSRQSYNWKPLILKKNFIHHTYFLHYFLNEQKSRAIRLRVIEKRDKCPRTLLQILGALKDGFILNINPSKNKTRNKRINCILLFLVNFTPVQIRMYKSMVCKTTQVSYKLWINEKRPPKNFRRRD